MSKIAAVLIAPFVLVAAVIIPAVRAANPPDLTQPIHQFIDGFNTGDTKSAFAAYVSGDVVIVDEFAPHLWHGPHAVQQWAADFDKMSQAEGSSDGKVKYSAPTHTEVEGDVAYVVIPTTFSFKQHGNAMTENGQMTLFCITRAVRGRLRRGLGRARPRI